MWLVECSNCRSEQTVLTMHHGWTVWYCENCHNYLTADGEVLSDEDFKKIK